MSSNNEKRLVEVWERGTWNNLPFSSLKKGQIFRMFEQGEGTRMEPVLNLDGTAWNRCTGTPYPHTNENGEDCLAIEAEPISKLPVEVRDS